MWRTIRSNNELHLTWFWSSLLQIFVVCIHDIWEHLFRNQHWWWLISTWGRPTRWQKLICSLCCELESIRKGRFVKVDNRFSHIEIMLEIFALIVHFSIASTNLICLNRGAFYFNWIVENNHYRDLNNFFKISQNWIQKLKWTLTDWKVEYVFPRFLS